MSLLKHEIRDESREFRKKIIDLFVSYQANVCYCHISAPFRKFCYNLAGFRKYGKHQ